MEINEYYNKRMAQNRDSYNETAGKLKDTYNKQVEDLENLHEAKTDKLRANYDEKTSDLERSNRQRLESVSGKSQDEIARKQKEFTDKLSEEKTGFENNREKSKNNFDSRLRDIKNSYDTSMRNKDKDHEDKMLTSQGKADHRHSKLNEEFSSNVKHLTDKNKETYHTFKEQSDNEKRNLIRTSQIAQEDQVRKDNIQKNTLKNQFQTQIEELRKAHEHEGNVREEHAKQTVDGIRNRNQDEIETQGKRFENFTEKLARKNVTDSNRMSREHALSMKQQERRSQKEIEGLRKKTDMITSAQEEGSAASKETDAITDRYEKRLEHSFNMAKDQQLKNQIEKDRLIENTQDDEKITMENQRKEVSKLNSDNHRYIEDMQSSFKKERDKVTDEHTRDIQQKEIVQEEKIVSERTGNKKLLENQRKVFGETVDTLQKKNIETVENLQSEFAKEKTTFIEKNKKDNYDSLNGQREDFRLKIDKMVESYEKRLVDKDLTNQRTIEIYENKLAGFQKKLQEETNNGKRAFDDMRYENEKSTKQLVEAREREYFKRFMEVKNRFDKEIATSKYQNDLNTTKLTQRYEEKISQMKNDYEREIKQRNDESRSEYTRLAETSKIQLDALRDQYEAKISKIRSGNMANEYEKTLNKEA